MCLLVGISCATLGALVMCIVITSKRRCGT